MRKFEKIGFHLTLKVSSGFQITKSASMPSLMVPFILSNPTTLAGLAESNFDTSIRVKFLCLAPVQSNDKSFLKQYLIA